ncbi:MAG: hypothetical protein QXH64_03750 [Nitrososphaeria archaeon]
MSENKLSETEWIVKKAKALRQKEVYKIVDKKANYMIGIGVKNITSKTPSYFIEIVLNLCPKSGKLDLNTLKQCFEFLQKLCARNYSLTCQDDNTIICDITIGRNKLEDEYMSVKSFLHKLFEHKE